MGRRSRLVAATVIGALLAVAVAVPVVAQVMGTPAISGYSRMYSYAWDISQEPTATIDFGESWHAVGSSRVRMTFDTQSDPYFIKYLLAGTRLQPCTEYALVNVIFVEDKHVNMEPTGEFQALLRILKEGRTSKTGTLTLKGMAGGNPPTGYSYPLYEDFDFDWPWYHSRLRTGADLWLVPNPDERFFDVSGTDPNRLAFISLPSFPQPEPGFVYTALGLPAVGWQPW